MAEGGFELKKLSYAVESCSSYSATYFPEYV